MVTQISFTADKMLKNKAMEKARQDGITLKALLTFSMRSFVEGKMKLGIIPTHREPEIEELIFEDKELNRKGEKLVKLLK